MQPAENSWQKWALFAIFGVLVPVGCATADAGTPTPPAQPAAAATESDDAVIQAYLIHYPDLAKRLKPADPALPPPIDPAGRPLGAVTLSDEEVRAAIADTIRAETDVDNLAKVLRLATAGGATGNDPASSDDLQTKTPEELRAAIEAAVGTPGAQAAAEAGVLAPQPNWWPACDHEAGYGGPYEDSGTGDLVAYRAGEFSPNGLQRNVGWPLQSNTTCVRNQGGRGTCVSFAVAGSIESLLARHWNLWTNLSEQSIYSHYKTSWERSLFSDGASTRKMLDAMHERDYRVPYESDWRYNPAFWRVQDAKTGGYGNSCKNYAETCSDTSGQALATGSCAGLANGSTKGCTLTVPSVPGAFPTPASASILFFSWKMTHPLAHQMSAQGNPMVLGLKVTPSFDQASKHDGFVIYTNDDESSRGGHAVEVVAVLTNEDLVAAGAISVPPGAGGGYYVIKNSWSPYYGDGGYAYLPFKWVSEYGTGLVVLY